MRRTHTPSPALRASVVAVQGALAILAAGSWTAASAADPAVDELTQPRSSVEAGAIYVDKDSYKFGEYNGLQRKGLNPDLSFQLRGGGAYDQQSGSTQRWRLNGTHLGLDNRNLSGEYSQQGQFNIRFEYDELRRNYTDNYLSLWNGVGSSMLTLPAGYPTLAARAGSSGLFNWNNIQAPNLNSTTTGGGPGYVIPALMHTEKIGTTRTKAGLAGDVALTPQWTLSVNARNEHKDGTKLTGSAMGGFKGALVPEPIDSDTTVVEAALRYATREANLSVAYNTSFYRNHTDAWAIEYPFSSGSGSVLNGLSVMNGAPDNQMHQVAVEGGWRISPTLKLTGAGSYTRMTQNEAFHYQAGPGWNVNGGATSADQKEIQRNLLLRLTATPMQGLDLNAAIKFDDRDNRSPVGLYKVAFYDSTSAPSAANIYRNVPLNRKQDTFTLDGRYSLGRDRWVSAGYEHQVTERTADASINPLSQEINNPFASGKAKEDTLRAAGRMAFTDAVAGQLSYAHSRRRAEDYEEAEINPPGSSSNVGFFSEVPGFRQFFLNDRNRDKARAALDIQASESLFLQAGVDLIRDRYPGGEFGLKQTDSTAFNLDASYAASDKLQFNAFTSFEDMKSLQRQYQIPVARVGTTATLVPHTPDGTCAPYSNASGTLPADYLTDPCRNWTGEQADKVWTLGLGAKSAGWLGGKLTLSADATYSRARTNLNFTGGTYYSNGLTSFVYVPAQNMPAITSTMTDLKLGAAYAFTKESALKVSVLHRRLRSSDPQFDLFGITSVQAYIGPGFASPKYDVNAISIMYVYSFR